MVAGPAARRPARRRPVPSSAPMRLAPAAPAVLAAAVLVACGAAPDGRAARSSSEPAPPPVAALGPREAIVAAAGDIACAPGQRPTASRCRQAATAAVVRRLRPDAVLALGDLQYGGGALAQFRAGYGRTWGAVKRITVPVPGNHEYDTPGAAGYFAYWGAAAGRPGQGWHARDLGSWRVITLNSNCDEAGGCGPGSAQLRWLERDLRVNPRRCTVALWHHPRFSSGSEHGSDPRTAPLWAVLARRGADLVLTGHDHGYERFAPQTSSGRASAAGLRQIVVGTGGRSLHGFSAPQPNSVVRGAGVFGVLELGLHARGYTWRFRRAAGAPFADTGRARCR